MLKEKQISKLIEKYWINHYKNKLINETFSNYNNQFKKIDLNYHKSKDIKNKKKRHNNSIDFCFKPNDKKGPITERLDLYTKTKKNFQVRGKLSKLLSNNSNTNSQKTLVSNNSSPSYLNHLSKNNISKNNKYKTKYQPLSLYINSNIYNEYYNKTLVINQTKKQKPNNHPLNIKKIEKPENNNKNINNLNTKEQNNTTQNKTENNNKKLDTWKRKALFKRRISSLLSKFLFKLNYTKSGIISYNNNRWLCHAEFRKQNQFAQVIQNYCKKQLNKLRAKRNWKRICAKLYCLKFNKNRKDIIKKIKKYLLLKKFLSKIRKPFNKKVISALKRKKNLANFANKLKIILTKLNKNFGKVLLKHYFDRWRNKVNNLNLKKKAIDKMMKMLGTSNRKNNARAISNCLILKSLFHDILKLKALACLRKLSNVTKSKNANENLKRELLLAKNDLNLQKKKKMLKKIFKLFAFKKLTKLFDNVKKLQFKNYREPLKEFFDLLRKNLLKHCEYTYMNKLENSTKNAPKKLHYTSIKDKKSYQKKVDKTKPKKIAYVILTPHLVNYLQNKIDSKKTDFLSRMKKMYRSKKLTDALKKYVNKKELPNKKEFMTIMQKCVIKQKEEGNMKVKLYKLFRKKIIKTMFTKIEEPSRFLKLSYLINITTLNKKLAKNRWIRAFIRKWRFISFSKRVAKKKMSFLYKNLHINYLEMMNGVFGEDESQNSPSVLKEFERFSSNVGMWQNENPDYDERKSFVKKLSKKMSFHVPEPPKKVTTMKETIEEEKKILKVKEEVQKPNKTRKNIKPQEEDPK